MVKHKTVFSHFARQVSRNTGHPVTFILAMLVILVWLITGPLFHFSDTWQLVINTGTTIITFLMVFLIQNTQNRDSDSMQLKLDEIIRSIEGAHNALLNLEDMTQEELDRIKISYSKLAALARTDLQSGLQDTGRPEFGNDSLD